MTSSHEWLLTERLEELRALPFGWDGSWGVPVRGDCIYFARRFLGVFGWEDFPMPSLIPCWDGTLQIEWHRNDLDLEIAVLGEKEAVATRRNIRTGHREERLLKENFYDLEDWINAL